MYIMHNITILNSDIIDISNMIIYCSFAAVDEIVENCVIEGNIIVIIIVIVIVIIISVGDVDVCILLWIAIAIVFVVVVRFLGLLMSCLFCDIFLSDSFIAIDFDVIDIAAMIAKRIFLDKFVLPLASEINLSDVDIIIV